MSQTFTNITLYYLKQMGINPWVTGKITVPCELKHPIKLAVLISVDFNAKTQSLFNYLMKYLSVKNEEVLFLKTQPQEEPRLSEIQQHKPLAILALGVNNPPFGEDLNCPIIHSEPLEYLLANPSSKRKIFQDLSYLKTHILL